MADFVFFFYTFILFFFFFFFQAEDGIRDADVTGVQTCALPISSTDEILDFTHLEELTEIRFNIYPNPANHVVNIDFAETLNLGKVMVTDLSGRTLIQQSIVGQSSLNVDVSALANGVYTISIINESGNLTTKKLIVQ